MLRVQLAAERAGIRVEQEEPPLPVTLHARHEARDQRLAVVATELGRLARDPGDQRGVECLLAGHHAALAI